MLYCASLFHSLMWPLPPAMCIGDEPLQRFVARKRSFTKEDFEVLLQHPDLYKGELGLGGMNREGD